MKKIILIIIFLYSFSANAQIIRAELTATGLTCSMCTKATYTKLSSISSVEKITTDINNSTFILYFKKDNKIDVEQIKTKVIDAGFTVGSLILIANLNNQKASNNTSFLIDNSTFHFIETTTQTLNGEVRLKVLDKGFITSKEYKKLLPLSIKYTTYKNAMANHFHIKPL